MANILTSGGITAGIDMSLYLVNRLCGQTVTDLVHGARWNMTGGCGRLGELLMPRS